MPPKKTYAKGGGKSKPPPVVKQSRDDKSSKSKKRKARHSSESGSDSEAELDRHRTKRGRPSDNSVAPKAGGRAKHPPKGKRVTRKDEQSDDTEEADESDSDDSAEEGDEKFPPDTPPSEDMDLSTLVSSTQTTAMKERRIKRIKTWGALQTKAVDDGFTLVGPTTFKNQNIKDQIKEVIESCKAEVEESKQAWKGAMRAIDQKTNGVNEMTESLSASCKDGRSQTLAVLHAAIEDAKGYDARLAGVVANAESMRDADIRSMTDAFAKRDDAGAFISRLRHLIKMVK